MPRLQPDWVYDKVQGGFSSSYLTARVLQIFPKELSETYPTIEAKLSAAGISETDILRKSTLKEELDKIIRELKSEDEHHNLFNRALAAGESEEDIDKTIRSLIQLVHQYRRKRHVQCERRQGQKASKYSVETGRKEGSRTMIAEGGTRGKDGADVLSQPRSTMRAAKDSTVRVPHLLLYLDLAPYPYLFRAQVLIDDGPSDVPRGPQIRRLKEEMQKAVENEELRINWNSLVCDMEEIRVMLHSQDVFEAAYESAQRAKRHVLVRAKCFQTDRAFLASGLTPIDRPPDLHQPPPAPTDSIPRQSDQRSEPAANQDERKMTLEDKCRAQSRSATPSPPAKRKRNHVRNGMDESEGKEEEEEEEEEGPYPEKQRKLSSSQVEKQVDDFLDSVRSSLPDA